MKLLDTMHKYKTMISYCLKIEDTGKINPRFSKTSNNKTMLFPKCDICVTKKSRFIEEQESVVQELKQH